MPKWDRRKFLAYAVQISVLYFVFSLLRIPPKLEHGQSEKKKYLIPFISGQGLNNQLWEYRSAAILARSTGRVLCLVPFHRFYLQETGREFIPFQELFDAESIKKFVQISTVDNCSDQCNREIQQHLQLITNSNTPFDRKNPFPIAEWRPGSLKLFLKSTGFKSLSVSKMININISEYDKVNSNILEYMNEVLSRYQNSQCVSILGTIPHLSREFLQWSRVLNVNQNIRNAVNKIKNTVFNGERYIAIHWRFEETKCAGLGLGIGFGRSSDKARKTHKNLHVRKSDVGADLCFFAGPLPAYLNKKGIWLRVVSRAAVVKWIMSLAKERKVENIYLASDCHDAKLLQWIKDQTGAKSKIDIISSMSEYIPIADNDIVSRVEQQICTESFIFSGTSMSSWTSSVIEERFKDKNSFFIQDKFNIIRRPDPLNRTLYFDIETCQCDWEVPETK